MRTFRLVVLGMALMLSRPAWAQTDPGRTAVISAFAPELEALKAAATERQDVTIHGSVFTTGRLEGRPVVLFLSGVSMVNAAMTTQLALDNFPIRRIVVSGVGGGADPDLAVGDVVVAERWGEYQETRFGRRTDQGFDFGGEGAGFPAFGMAIPRGVTLPGASGPLARRFWFDADPGLLALAQTSMAGVELSRCVAAACLEKTPKVVVGGAGVSGPTFVDNAEFRQYARDAFQARVLDMETAAVAHVAYVNATPFIAFRSLSDLAGGDPASNQFLVFIRLAAENSARTVRAFMRALPD